MLRQKLARPRIRRSLAEGQNVFDEVSRRTLVHARDIAACRRDTVRLLEETDALPAADRLAKAITQKRWQNAPVCELLLERAKGGLESRDGTASAWAELSVAIAERLDVKVWGLDAVADLRCRAWSALGESRRLAQDLDGADRALAAAAALSEGTGDRGDRLEAEVSFFTARLRIDQHRLEEAGRLIDSVVALYRQGNDNGLLCRALLLQGALLNWIGKDNEALERLQECLSRLDRQAEPRLCAEAFYRLVPLLKDPQESLLALRESQALYEYLGDRPNLARLRRLEGKVAEVCGQLALAELHLEEARRGLLVEGLGREAAQAALELVLLHSRQGKAPDMHQIAHWTFPVFPVKSVQGEAILALLAVHQEADGDPVAPAFIDQIARYLDPAPRPGPSGLSTVH